MRIGILADIHEQVDPYDSLQLWYFEGPPDTREKAAQSFAAVPQRFLFLGHFHFWLLMTPAGPVPWDGRRPTTLDGQSRYLVVVAPLFSGHCAIFDTESSELLPLQVSVAP